MQAAIDGVGHRIPTEQLCASHIAAGRLVPLLEAWSAPFPGFHLCFPAQRQMAPPLRAFYRCGACECDSARRHRPSVAERLPRCDVGSVIERRIPILYFVGPFPPDEESLWRLGVHCGLHSKSMAAPTRVTSGEYATGDRSQGVRSCEHPGISNFILRQCVWPRLRLFKIP